MESFRHASHRAASLLRTRAQPICRLTSRVTIKDLRIQQASIALKPIQNRFYSDFRGEQRTLGYSPRDDRGANVSQFETAPSPEVYVGNLFFDVTAGQLRQHFERFGEIQAAKVVTNVEGHSKGFGFVTFATTEAATKAREALNLSVFAGRRIIVHYGRTRAQIQSATEIVQKPSSTLFIGNLAYDMSDQELNELFRPLKDIHAVRVSIDKRTGHPRGFAHADFFSEAAATAAMAQLQGRDCKGRILRIDYGVPAAQKRTSRKDERVVKAAGGKSQDVNSSVSQRSGEQAEGTSQAAEKTKDVTSSSEQSHEEHSEGTSQPAENISDHPETGKEKEFEQPGQGPEEQLHEETDKTPEDQAKQ